VTAPQADSKRESSSGDSLAHIRHELRTPMNHILGYCEMLLEQAEELGADSFTADLQRIHAAGKQLLALLNELLEPLAGDEEMIKTAPAAFWANVRHELRTPINHVIGYGEMLQEETQEAGHAEFTPDLGRILSAARHLLVLITEVFDPEKIAKGAIELRAETLDRPLPLHSVTPPTERPARVPVRAGGTLLVVDDNDINRDMLSRRLRRQGYTVDVAENGRRALEMIAVRDFDLVLLDIMMPDLDGYQVLAHLKGDARTRDIPVIMISALDEIESVVRCIEMGAEDYLPKPFDPVLLRARIGASLEKKRLRDQEVEYLHEVGRVTAAAAAVEENTFRPEELDGVAQRADALGQLARVFQRMAHEVYEREQRLKQEVHQLRIEINEVRKAREVAEITETEYFQELRKRAQALRNRAE
jgi:DNA-binding response OmpR family regulator